LIRKIFNGVLIAGGPHFGFIHEAEQTLSQLPIDSIIIGEGELAILQLLNDYPNTKPIYDCEPIKNLENLPFPYWPLFELSKYNSKSMAIHTSRGCPYRCTFCSSMNIWGKRVRFRSAENVVREMDLLHELYGYNRFFFTDDTFVLKSKRIKHFADCLENKPYKFFCHGRINLMTNHLLADLKRAGCFRIDYGVETFVQRISNRIQKDINIAQVEPVIKKTVGFGMQVKIFMMLSLPSESLEDMRYSVCKAVEMRRKYGCSIELQLCRIYPGTQLAAEVGLNVEDWEKKIHGLRLPNVPIYLEYPLSKVLKASGAWLTHEHGIQNFRTRISSKIPECFKPVLLRVRRSFQK